MPLQVNVQVETSSQVPSDVDHSSATAVGVLRKYLALVSSKIFVQWFVCCLHLCAAKLSVTTQGADELTCLCGGNAVRMATWVCRGLGHRQRLMLLLQLLVS